MDGALAQILEALVGDVPGQKASGVLLLPARVRRGEFIHGVLQGSAKASPARRRQTLDATPARVR